MTNDKSFDTGASDLIEAMAGEFGDLTKPATLSVIADLYGALAAQHEAVLAPYALAMKANPKLIFTDDATAAQAAISQSVDTFQTAILKFARLAGAPGVSDE